MMTLMLPKKKIKDLISECKRMKVKKFVPIRKLASLIGKISATANAVFPARLNSRSLLRDKNAGLKKQGWNGTVNLSNESITQLDWWIQNLPHWNGKSMIPKVSKTTIFTDASISGWGASRVNCTIHGRWSTMERQLHINLLELQAILFALMAFKDIQNQLVTIRTDNTTCVAYINHQGGTVSTALSKIAENLWNLCLKRNIHLRAEHIPGTQNLIVDQASLRKLDRHD